jgi:solute:Na+ symporter, SSS family
MNLQLLDLVSFLLYFFLLCFIGWYVGRNKKKVASDYFLAGKALPWYVVGSSYIAANISTEHFLGMIGAAVLYGIVVATPEWSSIIAFTFLIWLFITFLLNSQVYTIPEFLERRFSKKIRVIFAVITVLTNVTAFMAPVIYGGGLVVEQALGINNLLGLDANSISADYIPNWGLFISIAIIAFASGVWTIWGGLKSVAWMDVLTIIIMVLGGLLVTVLGLMHIGDGSIIAGFERMIDVNQCHDGWSAEWLHKNVGNMLVGATPETEYNRLSVLQPINHATTPWTHWVFSFFYIGMWYTVINQHMIQKVFAVKNIYHARMGMVFASFLKLLLPFIVVIPGLIWFVERPDYLLSGNWSYMSEEANKTYIMMIAELVPPFVTGILLASLFGAIQSTVSSVLNSTSTVFTMDLYKPYINKNATDKEEVKVGRWAGIFFLSISIVLAIMLAMTKINIFVYIQTMYTFVAPPFSAIFLLGMIWKRVSGRDALTAIIVSFAFAVMLKYLEFGPLEASQSEFAKFIKPFANQGLIVWGVAMITCTISALYTQPPKAEQLGSGLVLDWKNLEILKDGLGNRWYKSVTFWWALSFVTMILLIICFSLIF